MKKSSLMMAIAALVALASCQKAPEYYMELSDKNLSAEAEGGTVSFDLSTNTFVRVNNDMDWASLDEGVKSGDVTTYTLTVEANPVTERRVGTIRFIGDGVTPLKLTLTQKALIPIGVTPTEINVERAATSAKFTVLGEKAWTATSDNPAFTLNPASGAGETDVTVSFPENEAYTPAVANITVKIGSDSYSVKITQAAALKKEYKDLSAAAKANCYVITEGGYYKFDATVRGNGVVPASQVGKVAADIAPAAVKVLWSTYMTTEVPASDSALISDLALEGGYVLFSTGLDSFVKGNAVIAALDAEGTILWSWHIWLSEAISDIAGASASWMDRNLGALVACTKANNADPLTFGFHYQWGRKDPFRCLVSYNKDNEPMISTTGTWPEPVLMAEGVGGIVNSIKEPQTFYYAKNKDYNNKDWQWGEQFDDLWGGGADDAKAPTIAKSAKTMFDPCPAGYAIPTSLQWQNMASDFGISKSDIDKTNGGVGNDSFWLVYPSGPVYDSGKFDAGSSQPVGTYSWYAGSCTNTINMLCLRSNTSGFNAGLATSARSAGYTVRCVKE